MSKPVGVTVYINKVLWDKLRCLKKLIGRSPEEMLTDFINHSPSVSDLFDELISDLKCEDWREDEKSSDSE